MRTIIEDFYRALERCDAAGLERVLASRWEELPPVYPGQRPGPAAYLRVAEGLRASLADLHFEILEILESPPNKFIVRTRFHGVHHGTFLGRPATGKKLSFDAIDIHETDGAQIIRTWHIEDFLTALSQIASD